MRTMIGRRMAEAAIVGCHTDDCLSFGVEARGGIVDCGFEVCSVFEGVGEMMPLQIAP